MHWLRHTPRWAAFALTLSGYGYGCGGDDLGACDMPLAQELVYGRANLVATKGQALLHDSCGNAAFCHSTQAKSDLRYGAPADMSFDMLPSPTGLPRVLALREEIWSAVVEGEMPPSGVGHEVLGDGDWRFSAVRDDDAESLPPIASEQGKGILRNFLACGAPVVVQAEVPEWARPPEVAPDAGSGAWGWSEIYAQVMEPSCALSGCHNAAASGGLDLSSECTAYRQLKADGSCGAARVVPGDGSSLLLEKLESSSPECGSLQMPPPPFEPLSDEVIAVIRAWIESGAAAEACE